MKTTITSHLEDYLKAIHLMSASNGSAHASEVAHWMGVTRASVTGALRALAERGLIHYQPYQPVVLTETGRPVAQACIDRHEFLHGFFRDQLGLADTEAADVACQVEHVATPNVLKRMAEISQFRSECSAGGLSWGADGTLVCSRLPVNEACAACPRRNPRVSD